MKYIRFNQTGDTVIEVMIAVVIASLMIVSATTLTNKSLQNSQQAHEHSEAQKIAEGQLEQLRSYYLSNSFTPDHNRYYCVRIGGTGVIGDINGPFSDVASAPSNCVTGTVGYRTASKFEDKGGGKGLFTAEVVWDGPTGKVDTIKIVTGVYR